MSFFDANRLVRRARIGSRRRRFYGWNVVGAMFFGMFLVLGTRQSFGVFVATWEEEWGVTTGDISIAAAIGWIINGVSQPILGKIVDRYGGKVIVVISTVVLGIAYLLMAFIEGVLMLAVLSAASSPFSPAESRPAHPAPSSPDGSNANAAWP